MERRPEGVDERQDPEKPEEPRRAGLEPSHW